MSERQLCNLCNRDATKATLAGFPRCEVCGAIAANPPEPTLQELKAAIEKIKAVYDCPQVPISEAINDAAALAARVRD